MPAGHPVGGQPPVWFEGLVSRSSRSGCTCPRGHLASDLLPTIGRASFIDGLPSSNVAEASPSIEPSSLSALSSGRSPSGEHFVTWLRDSIQTRRLIINDAKALVHTVAGSVFLVSPGVFQRYAQEHPEVARLAKQEQQTEWAWVQKRFEWLGIHRKQNNGLNIWTCDVTGPRKIRQLHEYLLNDAALLSGTVSPDNPYLQLRQ
ncbi:conjugal transfer nickase/helicase domain-containing protein [Burkholderia gladioli]|uniref:Putative conjugal transfer nickase/helicase TraI C-terminal domain-containing protein n=1 Tax=Burkholderia gladioli TaxID=28095 RepID=A0A2A7SAR0_BURGA|nr:hypothetical protein CO712_35745 [Burkholderia gladioli pv. gladioli]MBJ9711243.1 DNA-binding domain-containing protein [Burkholderia gladioli]MDR8086221.1 DNA-binding domain-containing protein [Burkholderia gladioli]PEH40651.1 hypothetical protein CRM94_16820 [Burkholderia gladioli]